ncbi:hypothetical protein ISS21_00130 [Patescibacteria group bacterium]|nr:hypothetical protein [Patescibacteria group bacterium]
MPKEKKEEDHGQVILKWYFPEYTQYQRSKSWYVIVGLVLVIAIFYSFLTANFLFTLFLVLFGLIFILHLRRTPIKVEFKIFEDGLMVGARFYEWSEIRNFRLVYRPPETKRLYLDLKSVLIPDLSVSLEDQNPLEIRKALKEYLEEDLSKEEETLIDRLNRWLKI